MAPHQLRGDGGFVGLELLRLVHGRIMEEPVTPAQAGVQGTRAAREMREHWIPACAGMTGKPYSHSIVAGGLLLTS
ncbi:hypothetical protein GCM10028813_40180 [Ramlibacter alkalitolerans]